MQSPTIYALVAAGIFLILLLYLYFGQLGPASDELGQVREERTALESEVEQLEQQIAQLEDKLTVEMVERIHFESGSAHISDENKAKLQAIVQRLQADGNKTIRIVGHTDDRMIIPDFPRIYASNWELSIHRATHTVRVLEEVGVAPERMQAVGMSKYHPIASNDTQEGKAQNRRVEIYLVPER
jgi:chemotaxis protein MotB